MAPRPHRAALALALAVAFVAGAGSDLWMERVAPASSRARMAGLVSRLDAAFEQRDAEGAAAMLRELSMRLERSRSADDGLVEATRLASAGEVAAARRRLEDRLRNPDGLVSRRAAIVALVLASRSLSRGNTDRAIALVLPVWTNERAPLTIRMEAGLRIAQALHAEGRHEEARTIQRAALALPVPARTRLRLSRELGI